MAFDSFSEFLAMGNHGFYVWLAYGLTFLVLGVLAWHSLGGHSVARREIAAARRRNSAAQTEHSRAQALVAQNKVEQ